MALVERLAVVDRDHHVLQAVPRGDVVVHVAGTDHAHAHALGEGHEGVVAGTVAVDEIVLQLDEDVRRAEPTHEPAQRLLRLALLAFGEEPRDAPLAAAAEGDEAAGMLFQPPHRQERVEAALLLRYRILLFETEGVARKPAEVGVTLTRLGQEGEMGAGAVLLQERDLETRDRPQPRFFGGPRELHRPKQAIVVGEGEGAVTLRNGRLDQLIEAGGAFEERVVGVQVQLHVGRVVEDRRGDGLGGVAGSTGAGRIGIHGALDVRAAGEELLAIGA